VEQQKKMNFPSIHTVINLGGGMITLTCLECGWSGYPEELVCLTDSVDDKDFSYCPHCEKDNFEEDEENDL